MTTIKKQKEMRQLSRLENVVLLVGALLMTVGAGLYVFGYQSVSPILFAVGAVAFATMQMRQTYDGRNITVRRLRRIMTVGDVLFVLSGVLMLEDKYLFIQPLFTEYFDNGYYAYVTYVHNNWVVLLLVAAIIEIYTTHRISHELGKEAKKL